MRTLHVLTLGVAGVCKLHSPQCLDLAIWLSVINRKELQGNGIVE